MLVKASKTFNPKSCSVRKKLNGDKKRSEDFRNGKEIEITEDEYKLLNEFGWVELVKATKSKGVKDG